MAVFSKLYVFIYVNMFCLLCMYNLSEYKEG